MTPLAYSVPDAAKAIGVSKATMWRHVAAGTVAVVRLGGRTLIRAEELSALLDRSSAL